MRPHVVFAVFRRNLISYFTNPAGYLFICGFVFACAMAAYWPDAFFNANLANLDQLNSYLPYILLVFIPAITMSIWAEERRQGTDELLLTIPAGDFDVVLGKYLAAVAIYSAAILFSVVNLFWLAYWAGWGPDWGLLAGNYFGYWLVGLAMLSIGMVASFLTANLTVGFILGVLFNIPLVFANWVGDLLALRWPELGLAVKGLSLSEQFRDFGQGVVSFNGVLYFSLVIVVMLYVSMALIGRRHWWGPSDGPALWLSLAYAFAAALVAILLALLMQLTDKGLAILVGVAFALYVVGFLVLWGLGILHSLLGHYLIRTLVMALAAVFVLTLVNHLPRLSGARLDVTAERLSSLAPQTRTLISGLKPEQPVQIEAYVSPTVPESYVQTRLNLLNMLREVESLGGGKITVHVHPTEPLSEQAQYAEQQFGITSQQVAHRTRGAMSVDPVFLGVAVTSKLNKVVVPFFDRGVPVEYELLHSIGTVTQQKRKRVAVLTTDAKLYGGFNMQTMSSSQNERIIEELQKQYEVVQVNADAPIQVRNDKGELINDVLLAVQPSSLSPEQMPNFIAAVKAGQPTAIFEDPFPYLDPSVPGTTAEKQPPGGMNPFMGQQPPMPKGDITPLWEMLGVSFAGVEKHSDKAQVVWQDYNPYPKIGQFPLEFVFVSKGSGAEEPFNEQDPVTSKLQQMLFLFPGWLRQVESAGMEFEPLLTTGTATGYVPADQIVQFGRLNPELAILRKKTNKTYPLAVMIHGKPKGNLSMSDKGADEGDAQPGESPKPAETPKPAQDGINVALVADIDCLYSAFFDIRQRGEDPDAEVNLSVDNVTFVLNLLDSLAQDDRFITVRKRRPAHRTLTLIEEQVAGAKDEAAEARRKFTQEFDDAKEAAQKAFDAEIKAIEEDTSLDESAKARKMLIAREVGQRRLQSATEQLQRKRDASIRQAERVTEQQIRAIQSAGKAFAGATSWILPFLLGVGVWGTLMLRETEGVSRSRLR